VGLVLHRTPHPFIRQQTAVINAIRAVKLALLTDTVEKVPFG
jgi:hypothetical protein